MLVSPQVALVIIPIVLLVALFVLLGKKPLAHIFILIGVMIYELVVLANIKVAEPVFWVLAIVFAATIFVFFSFMRMTEGEMKNLKTA